MTDDEILNQYSTARPEGKNTPETSDDDILNLYSKARPEAEKAKQAAGNEFWQGLNDDPSWSALAKRIGIGAARGVKDVIDTGAHGLANTAAYLAEKTLPNELSAPIRKSAEAMKASDKTAREQFEQEYPSSESMIPTATDVGRIGGQIVGTLPIMPTKIIQGVNAAAGALPTVVGGVQKAAPIVNRLVGAAGTGAIGGATLGASTASTNDKSLTENMGEGALTGAIAGPVLTGAASAGKALGGKVIGGISQSTAELAKRAEELGIDLKATQVSGSPLLKKFDQMSGMLPFSGQQGIKDSQIAQFYKAVSNTFGEDTHDINLNLIQSAKQKIGADMNAIKQGSINPVDSKLATDLHDVLDKAEYMTPDEQRIIKKHVSDVAYAAKNGTISGEALHNLTKFGTALSNAQESRNPNIAKSANNIRQSLEGLLARNLSPDQLKAWQEAKGKYKAAKTTEEWLQQALGDANPLTLLKKVSQAPGGKLGGGDLGELGEIARKFFPESRDSGTPIGTKVLHAIEATIHSPITAFGAAGAAAAHGAFLADIAAGGAGLAGIRLARSAVNSKFARNALIRSGTGETHGVVNKLTGKVVPYASVPIINRDKDREPLRITVNPK